MSGSAGVFRERQVYRIDHYLGKETVQNILVLRYANSIFEPIWNRNYVDHVQITTAAEVTVGRRAGYYDTAGVVRDMFSFQPRRSSSGAANPTGLAPA